MDTFMNLAKQGFEAYESHQGGQGNVSGGSEYNAPSHSQGGGNAPSFDHDEVVSQAAQNSDGSTDSSMYSHALNYVKENHHQHTQPVDEEGVQNAHQQAYSQGNASSLPAESMGSAAAMQILKQFTSGGGGGTQSQLISMAMSEAGNLFEASGGAASGSKQDAINGAAMTVMKLMVQSQFSSMMGGSNSGGFGGMGSMLSMASKFM